ncbi:MAG: phosphoribosyl-ATP diphosphatase [Spartobacteria bacterium]|nr:phosphoribosyl-ATP diphosphatase [Spartobacteria bacterium]
MKTFEMLFEELQKKAASQDTQSGTVKALKAGKHAIGKKIVEEAAEVWMASEFQSKEEAAEEMSQLLYHVQVMMLACDLTLEDVYTYL